jgi:pyrroloquinoline quinone biosynthesis protein B
MLLSRVLAVTIAVVHSLPFLGTFLFRSPGIVVESGATRAVVLGVAQDGGFPHIGCRQDACIEARRNPALARRVASLGLIDGSSGQRFLIDASPDLPAQVAALGGVDGILLTHAHMGHILGLLYLGREALGAQAVPVYATARMTAFLRANGLWSQLVTLGNIDLRPLEPGKEVRLSPRIAVTPFLVPHRDEFTDTVGFRIAGPAKRLLSIPDIDKWSRWDHSLADEVAGVDAALLDGTFADAGELPGRSQADIPHPLLSETLAAVPVALRSRIRFLHLNHTNRLLWDPAAGNAVAPARAARQGEEITL